jgi:hypothetical protein
MAQVIGGVPEIPDICLGDVITEFYQQQGLINEWITRRLEMQSKLLSLGMRTRKQFPAGMGDVYKKVILTSTRPTSAIGKDWSRLQAAYPGGPVPTCRIPEVIRYGHLTTQACLEKKALRTPDFNSVDLTFKTRREMQWGWLMNTILPDWSMAVQKFWYREAYRKNVWNIVLDENWQISKAIGEFATWSKPQSIITPDYLDEIYRFLASYGANQTPYTGTGDGMLFHVLVTGPDEARALDELDRQANAGLGSRWTEIVIPGYGQMRVIRNFVIMIEDDIPRLGVNPDGTYYEVEATREVEVLGGTESEANPDYYNPAIALYTQSYIWNVAATDWYVPPDFTQFPNQVAGNWNGAFNIVNLRTPEDPNAENAYFLATFAFGMGPNIENRRGMVILSKAVHRRGKNVCLDYGVVQTTTAPVEYTAKNFYRDAYLGMLGFETNTEIPTTCPAQHALYLITQRGARAQIATLMHSDAETTRPFNYKVYLTNNALATVRECDPWTKVACLPIAEPDTVVVGDDCATCGGATPVCDWEVEIETTSVLNIRMRDGKQLNDEAGFAFPYNAVTQLATLDANLTSWLADHGGGAVVASNAAGVLTLTVTGTEACFGQIVGSLGSMNFTKSNCTEAP